jgi:hypothetical protein
MAFSMSCAEHQALRNLMTSQMMEAVGKVLRDNGTPGDEIDKMLPSLKPSLLHWFIENHTYEDPNNLWSCKDCRLNNVLCQSCLSRSVM